MYNIKHFNTLRDGNIIHEPWECKEFFGKREIYEVLPNTLESASVHPRTSELKRVRTCLECRQKRIESSSVTQLLLLHYLILPAHGFGVNGSVVIQYEFFCKAQRFTF